MQWQSAEPLCHAPRMTEDEVLAQAKKIAAARLRAQDKLEAAEHAEDLAIQDAYDKLGPGYGNVTKLAGAFSRSREHIRRVIDPKNQRGRHSSSSSSTSTARP